MSRWYIHLENDEYVVYQGGQDKDGNPVQRHKKVKAYAEKYAARAAIYELQQKFRSQSRA